MYFLAGQLVNPSQINEKVYGNIDLHVAKGKKCWFFGLCHESRSSYYVVFKCGFFWIDVADF